MRVNAFGVSPHPPQRPPLPPVPELLEGLTQHGINCVCIAAHFGLDREAFGSTPGCGMTERAYRREVARAQRLQSSAKLHRLAGRIERAHDELRQLLAIGEQLDSIELAFAALSDLGELLFAAGAVAQAESCADEIITSMPRMHAAIEWVQQGTTVRQLEECRDMAERTKIRVLLSRDGVDEADALIITQRTRFERYREAHAAVPEQIPADLLAHHRVMELSLRFEEVHALIGHGRLREAEDACATLLDDVAVMRASPPPSQDAAQNLPVIEAEVRMQLEALRAHAGRADDAGAGIARLASELRSGTVAEPGTPAVDAALSQLRSMLDGLGVSDAGPVEGADLRSAIDREITGRDAAARAHRVRDVADGSVRIGSLLLLAGESEQARAQLDHAASMWEATGATGRLIDLVLPRAMASVIDGDHDGALRDLAAARATTGADRLLALRIDALRASITAERDGTAEAVAAALELALPAALAADELRYAYEHERQRTAWARTIAEPVLALALDLAGRAGDMRVAAELVERMAQLGAISVTATAGAPADDEAETAEPDADRRSFALAAGLLGVGLSGVAAPGVSMPGVSMPGATRLAPPRPLRWTPTEGSVLDAPLAAARAMYGLEPRDDAAVPTW